MFAADLFQTPFYNVRKGRKSGVRNIFLIGCGKCGTTSLAHLLDCHPKVVLSIPKESNFFCNDTKYIKGLGYYASLFQHKKDASVRVDGSVCYSLFTTEEKVCERIKRHFAEPKFIYIARNPYARIESAFRERHHHAYRDRLNIPFSLKEGLTYHLPVLLNSLYWQRTSPFRAEFGEDSLLYLTTEDLLATPDAILRKCFDFLEISNDVYPVSIENTRLNIGEEKLCDTPFHRLLQRNDFTWRFFQLIPKSVRSIVLARLRRPASCLDLTWDDEMRLFMSTFFKTDVKKFLQAAGKAATFWGLDFV